MSNSYISLKPYAFNESLSINTSGADSHHMTHRPLTEAVMLSNSCSLAFDLQYGINPLISAAASVLMVITTLKKHPLLSDSTTLYHALLQEINIFEKKTRKLDYRSPIILAARYLLCAFLDEVLCTTQNKIQQLWQHHPFLKTLQDETWGGERFFTILERASDDPVSHIDLLELGSLCLSLGYQGKYQKPEFPSRDLENIKDNVLMLIHKVRGDSPASLFLKPEKKTCAPIFYKKKLWKVPHLAIATSIFFIATLSVYIPYKIHLAKISRSVTAQVTQYGNIHHV